MILMKVLYWKSEVQFIVRKENFCRLLNKNKNLSCSPQTAATIDDMVVETVREGYDTAMDLLEKNKMKLHELAKYLYEKETITGEEFMQILNRKEISGEQIRTESED